MAVPRNQVAISGFVDPYGGLSRTFSDLSKTYAQKSATRDALALQQEELGLKRTAAGEANRRFDVEQKTGNDRWRVTRDEQIKARQHRELVYSSNQKDKQEVKNRARTLNRSLLNAANIDFSEAYNTDVLARQNKVINIFKSQSQLTKEYLLAGVENKGKLAAINNNFRDILSPALQKKNEKGELVTDIEALDTATAKRLFRFKALSSELASIADPKEREARADQFVKRQYTDRIQDIYGRREKGMGLTVEDRVEYALKINAGKDMDALKFRTGVAEFVGGRTNAAMVENEIANVDRRRELAEANIDRALKWYDSGNSDSRLSSTSANARKEGRAIMDSIGDLGDIDTPDVFSFYSRLMAEGIPPVFAASFTSRKVASTGFSRSFASPSSKKAGILAGQAREEYDALLKKYPENASATLTREDITINPADFVARSLKQIKNDSFRVRGATPIQVGQKFVDELVAKKSALEDKAKADAAKLLLGDPNLSPGIPVENEELLSTNLPDNRSNYEKSMDARRALWATGTLPNTSSRVPSPQSRLSSYLSDWEPDSDSSMYSRSLENLTTAQLQSKLQSAKTESHKIVIRRVIERKRIK